MMGEQAELKRLLAALCDGEIDARGVERIEELVRSDLAAKQLYIATLHLHSELCWSYANVSSGPLPTLARAVSRRRSPGGMESAAPSGRRPLALSLVSAVVAASLAIAGWWGWHAGRGSTPVVAVLRQADNCLWDGDSETLRVGAQLQQGKRLALVRGVARLGFESGATVLVASPAELILLSDNSVRLLEGSVAVRANGIRKDFVVESPDASILDLGTSFAVHYSEGKSTEVEVFEGAVELLPGADPSKKRVMEMGESVSFRPDNAGMGTKASQDAEHRFSTLLEGLWQDIRADASSELDLHPINYVEATFSDDPATDAVDVFYRAKSGSGWVTPWVAAGNPVGDVLQGDPAFGPDNPYLQLRFVEANDRAIGREYGPRGEFDPQLPHVLTWQWRMEGNPDDFNASFLDRVAFYGNPYFRRSTWPTNSWLIGVVGGNEVPEFPTHSDPNSSTSWLHNHRGLGKGDVPFLPKPRAVFPRNWYFYDSGSTGPEGAVLEQENMFDTGMELKFGVLYRFAVIVYPQTSTYDAAINDGEQTMVRTGLRFRDRQSDSANVFHASLHTDHATDDLGFSIDSLRIKALEPNDDASLLRRSVEDLN